MTDQTLFNPKARRTIEQRLSALTPSSPRQWGRMNAAQMLAHCAATLEMASGDIVKKQSLIGRVLGPLVLRRLMGPTAMQRNAPTDRAFKVIDDRDFFSEQARLVAIVGRFASRGPSDANGRVHSFFGRMTGEQWGRLMYKHLDHHIRQFGG